MGLLSSYLKRKTKQWFSSEYWTYQKVLFYYFTKKSGQQFTIRLHGKKIIANDAKALVGMYREIFLQQQYLFFSNKKDPVIIDCGANIGIASLFYKRCFPQAKITCIEADPAVAQVLSQNISSNNIRGIEIISKAAWINNGEKLQFSASGADAGSLYGDGKKIQVETVRLKDLLLATEQIDMLKIDIEGAEIEVMRDCCDALRNVKQIFVEFHSFPGKPQQLEELLLVLVQAGFRYSVLPVRRIDSPFTFNFANEEMDLQLNIFAYRS